MKAITMLLPALAWALAAQSQSLTDALQLYDKKEYQESVRVLNQLPESNDKHEYLGRNYLMLANHDESIAQFRLLTRTEPRNAEFHYLLGRGYLGKLAATSSFLDKGIIAAKARESLEKAVTLDSTHLPAKISLAKYYANAPPWRAAASARPLSWPKRLHLMTERQPVICAILFIWATSSMLRH